MNKIKVILFDVDQVLIKPPYYFSTELEKQGYKNVEEILTSFYTSNDFHKCSEGKGNMLELISPYLNNFGWDGNTSDYLFQQFQFEKSFVDKYLISKINILKKKNIYCCLSTDQEKFRAKLLLDNLGFKDKFDNCFISSSIGYRKCHDEFWVYVLDVLRNKFGNITTDEIVFFDDIQNNIDVALKFGIKAFLFTDNDQFDKDMAILSLL